MAYKLGIFNTDLKSGKTITAVYLAHSFATLKKNVLLVDLDINSKLPTYLSLRSEVYPVEIKRAESSWSYTNYLPNLQDIESQFEIIIFDFPSSDIKIVDENLQILDSVLIPVEAEFYGLDNLNKTFQKLNQIKNLKIEGILLTKLDQNNTLVPSLKGFLNENFSVLLMNTSIMRNYYLALPYFNIENLNHSIPNFGFADYLKLANELLEKNENYGKN